jgi:hypothetical protein
VARDLLRCRMASDGVRPGHESKGPFWTARRKVEESGLKAQA